MRMRHIRGAEQTVQEHPLSIAEPEKYRGKWKSEVFGNDHPLFLEIGTGRGAFIMENALRHPENNYIGMELNATVILKGLNRLEREMKQQGREMPENIRMIHANAEGLTRCFSRGEVDRIYLNFSDPWPKKRNANKRLTSPVFLRSYNKVLALPGRLEFKTDNRGLFDYSLESAEQEGWTILQKTYDLHKDPVMNEGNILTEYEAKFSALGNPIGKMIINRKEEIAMKKLSLAVVGATGAVGEQLLKVIEEREIPFTELKLLASARSAGKKVKFMDEEYTIEETTPDSFKGVDVALFAGGPASVEFGRAAAEAGTVVIDNSSTYRYEKDVPLVVPEVNASALNGHNNLIANPNCSTILLVTALYPLHKCSKVKRVIVSSYQACSGAGREGMEELIDQTHDVLSGKKAEPKAFKHQIAFNVIPQIDKWMDGYYTKEEMKFVWETHKIMDDESIGVTPVAAVRVPVIRSHCEAVYVETEEPISVEKAREIYDSCPWTVLQDDPENFVYPMPITSTDTDQTFVGRIRKDLVCENALNLWISFDQIRKGAATNAVQILEELLKRDLIPGRND